MAKTLPVLISTILFLSLLVIGEPHSFSRIISPTSLGLKREKLSHLRFYFHDTLSGPNATAIKVAEAATTNTSASLFGGVYVIDNPLTLGPDLGSKQVGRAQGIYAAADMNELGLLMAMTFAFMDGKFNGSNLSVLGRNAVMSGVPREMPIVGGSGVFRFARGYVLVTTHTLDLSTGDAVLEYNVYVFHYE